MNWHTDRERILDKIRTNSIILSKAHKAKYQKLTNLLRYFRLPVIILSGINSVISVGFEKYINQNAISLTTCLISLTCGIIGSVELYLAIQTRMENELNSSKAYYLLSVDIFKYLSLDREHRDIDGDLYMDKKYEIYCKLFENSNIIFKELIDKLTPLDSLEPLENMFEIENDNTEIDNEILGINKNEIFKMYEKNKITPILNQNQNIEETITNDIIKNKETFELDRKEEEEV